MMKIDQREIERISVLARLELTAEEKCEFSRQLSDIISYVEKINELDTGGVSPADHIVELSNVFRKDLAGESLERNELEKMAPRFDKGHIVVPKIIEGGE